ncbi:MAG: hypothetical protein SF052_12345 [Bacteroidia bacterium]|nr:hypothetical protein [Bacteroidia bacterium]
MFSPLKETHTPNTNRSNAGKKLRARQTSSEEEVKIVPLNEPPKNPDLLSGANQKKTSPGKMESEEKKVRLPVKKALQAPAKGGQKLFTETETWLCGKCQTENPVSNTSCTGCQGMLPVIALFKANPKKIVLGSPIRLSWEVFEADSVEINPGAEVVPKKGLMDVMPDETTEYSLTVKNEIGSRTLAIEVVLDAPKIHHFDATDTQIQVDFPTIFHWEVENGAELSLDMGMGDVSGKTFTEAMLTQPGKCTLTARNKSGVDTATIELTIGKPEITAFYAGGETIRLGEPNVLYWEVMNAEKLILEPGGVEFAHQTSTEVFPDKTTTYVLRAINAAGDVRKELSLVLPPPRVLHFGGEKELSTEGEPLDISWKVENAHTVMIDNEIGEVKNSGEIRFRPTQAYTYLTLTAKGHSGEVTQTIQLTRFPIPLEESLIPVTHELSEDMDLHEKQFDQTLSELEKLEAEFQKAHKQKIRELQIKQAQEMSLTDDMLTLKKASVRSELQNIIQKVKSIFSTQK